MKIIPIIFLTLILISPLILAQNDIKIINEPATYVPQIESGPSFWEFLFLGVIIMFLIIGVITIPLMIKNSSRTFHLVINSSIIVFAIISSVWGLFSSFSMGYFDPDFFEFLFPAVPLFLLSIYFLINLIKKDKFNEDKKYSLNFFGGAVITSILIIISMAIFDFIICPSDYIGLGTILVAGGVAVVSFVLGIVGLFVDYIKNK